MLAPAESAQAQTVSRVRRGPLETKRARRVIRIPPDPCAGNETPVADAGSSKAGEAGVPVPFDGYGSFDADGSIEIFQWNFGDGTTAYGEALTHIYEYAGWYSVTLTVTDDCGTRSAAALAAVTVSQPDPCAGNEAPVAAAGADRTAEPGQVVIFEGRDSFDDGTIDFYYWDFGDGHYMEGETVTHIYDFEGSYRVTLTVQDNCGAVSEEAPATVNVTLADALRGDAGPDRTVRVSTELLFDGTSSTGAIEYYFWDFGDGSFGFGPQDAHTYTDVGTYIVTLTVQDDSFAQAVDTVEVTVTPGMEVVGFPELLDGDYTVGASRGLDVHENTVWAIAAPDLLGTVDVENPEAPRILKVQALYGSLSDVGVGPSIAAIAAGYGGVYLFDATDPLGQTLLAVYNTYEEDGFRPTSVALSGNLLFVVGGSGGLRILDISTPEIPETVEILGSLVGIGNATDVAAGPGSAYVLASGTLQIIDVTNPLRPRLIATEENLETAEELSVLGSLLAVVERESIALFDVSDPTSPQWLAQVAIEAESVALGDGFAFVVSGGRVYRITVSDPGDPAIMEWVSLDRAPVSIQFHEGMVYVGVQGEWLRVVRP